MPRLIQNSANPGLGWGGLPLPALPCLPHLTLAGGNTLQRHRAHRITVTRLAALVGEAVVVGLTHVTLLSRHSLPTEALASVDITGAVQGTDGVTAARVTALQEVKGQYKRMH